MILYWFNILVYFYYYFSYYLIGYVQQNTYEFNLNSRILINYIIGSNIINKIKIFDKGKRYNYIK